MRLICPNCAAQYEVDAAMIPEAGCDVQCSSCGHTWYQDKAHPESDLADERGVTAPDLEDDPEAGDSPMSEPGTWAGVEPEPETDEADPADSDLPPSDMAEPDPVPAPPSPAPQGAPASMKDAGIDEDGEEEYEEDDTAPPPVPPRRRELDETTRAILREEAEREARARRGETRLETQSELGLDASGDEDERSAAVRARMARLRGELPDTPAPRRPEPKPDPAPEQSGNESVAAPSPETPERVSASERAAIAAGSTGAVAGAAGSRRDLLPDIEEINSTLTAASDRQPDEDQPEEASAARGRRGFRMGFSLVLLVTAAAILTYVFAPDLAQSLPGFEPWLASYVDQVNQMRQVLDGWLQQATGMLSRFGAEDIG